MTRKIKRTKEEKNALKISKKDEDPTYNKQKVRIQSHMK